MSQSPEARTELETLLNGAVEVAAERLEKDGEFDPFALALRYDGEVVQLDADVEAESQLEPEAVVTSLRNALRNARHEYKAVAVVADVTLEDENDQPMTAAIQISMEHEQDDPVNCYVPYEFEGKTLELAELVGEPGERHVFTVPTSSQPN